MSCSKATAPVNISHVVDDYCDLKCAYAYNYPITSLAITNRGDYLSMRVDQSTNPPVTFNNAGYRVEEVRLYTPSLHTYGDVAVEAELIIRHQAVNGSGVLLVCVPIVQVENNTSESLQFFDAIISQVAKTANVTGQQTVVNLERLTLNAFVPARPFYSYTGTLPFPPCSGEVNYVVFSPKTNAQALMSVDAFDTLNAVIKRHSVGISTKNGTGLFYNKQGAKLTGQDTGDGGIYIDCQPVGADGQVIVPNNRTSAQIFEMRGFKALLNNVLFQAIAGILLIVLLMKIGSLILQKISAPPKPHATGGTLVGGTPLGAKLSMKGGSFWRV